MGVLLVITAFILETSWFISVHGVGVVDWPRSDGFLETIFERDDARLTAFRRTLNVAVV